MTVGQVARFQCHAIANRVDVIPQANTSTQLRAQDLAAWQAEPAQPKMLALSLALAAQIGAALPPTVTLSNGVETWHEKVIHGCGKYSLEMSRTERF